MKKILLFLLMLLPMMASSQDKTPNETGSEPARETQYHPVVQFSNDAGRNMETILIDDRNYSRSLINFDLKKSYNLSFAERKTSLFEAFKDEGSDVLMLEPEPFLNLKWQD